MSLTRRQMLGATALGAAGLAIPGWRRPDEKIRLGVASYSLRNFKRAQAIEMVKACETKYVNVKSVHLPYTLSPQELAQGRKEFDDAGLEVVGSGNNGIGSEKELESLFDYAKAARFPLLVIAPKPELLPKIEAAVKKSGIPVAIHNHGPEDKIFPAPSDALKLIRDLDPRVGLCVDVGHTTRCGKDVVKEIADAGPRVLDMHMKDLKDLLDPKSQVAVGGGKMPVAEIFRQLVKQGYPGYVNLEYEIDGNDPLPGMKTSFAFMRKVAREVAGP
ncbi:MAG TPA: sugar phosphate isomerase/epimerase [Planctomycetota bacterium]|nr:sugar phosphate isomerase/epimerase [Planctomycetota bacterium]